MSTTPMSQETLLERFTQLTDLPTGLLVEMWEVTQEGAEVPERNGEVWRAQIIRVLAPNAAVTWQKTTDPKGEIQKDGISLLVKNFPKLYKEGTGLTSMSFKTMIDYVYDIEDGEIVHLNEPDTLQDKFGEFGKYFLELTQGNKQKVIENSQAILDKFKSLMFTTISRDVIDIIAANVSFDAATARCEAGDEPRTISYGYPNMVHAKMAFGNGIDCKTDEMFEKICPNWTNVANTTFVAETEVPSDHDDTTGNEEAYDDGDNETNHSPVFDLSGMVAAAEEAPENHPVFEPQNWTARVLKKDSAAAENIRELGLYKRMMPSRFTPWSWKVLRKNLDITGRAEIWILENPGENPTQNKELKYKSATVCRESDEGSFPDFLMPGVHFTNHPYGPITIIA